MKMKNSNCIERDIWRTAKSAQCVVAVFQKGHEYSHNKNEQINEINKMRTKTWKNIKHKLNIKRKIFYTWNNKYTYRRKKLIMFIVMEWKWPVQWVYIIVEGFHSDGIYLSISSNKHPNQNNYLWQFWHLGPKVFLGCTIDRLTLAAKFTLASSCFGDCSVVIWIFRHLTEDVWPKAPKLSQVIFPNWMCTWTDI